MAKRKRKAPAKAAPAASTPSPRAKIWEQRDELFDVMALVYAAAAIMDEKDDDEGVYVWRVLKAALQHCRQISEALDSIAAGVAHD